MSTLIQARTQKTDLEIRIDIHQKAMSKKPRFEPEKPLKESNWVKIGIGSLSPRTRSYKKDDETLLNLIGTMSSCSKKEGTYVYTKEGTRIPSLNTGGLVCTR
jgi:hypothetical protein